jgi:uncharacterized protein (TIGR04551 family)
MKKLWLVVALAVTLGVGQTALAESHSDKPAEKAGDGEKAEKEESPSAKRAREEREAAEKKKKAEEGDKADEDKAEGAEGEGAEGEESPSAKRAREEREAAEKKAREQAEKKAKAEAEAKARAEADAKAKADADAKAKADLLMDDDLEPAPEIDLGALEDSGIRKSYPYMEHHGYFRFRADALGNLDLNTTGTSPILPPPAALPLNPDDTESVRPDPDADWYSGSNIRFRYQPTLFIYEDLSVHLTMDVPDNLVLGSLPDGGRPYLGAPLKPDVPKIAFSGSQTPPDGRFGFRLKHAYGQVKTFFGLLRLGRMPSQFGLGILANSGGCPDCDYGDSADRALFVTRAFGTYFGIAYDFPSEGILDYNNTDLLGQPRDGTGGFDDVNQWVFTAFRRPLTPEEKAEQARELREEGAPVFNAGIYVVYREQEAAYEDAILGQDFDFDSAPPLEARGASAWIPDLWVQMLWEPSFGSRLRLEVEAVAIYGEIDYVSLPSSGATDCFSAANQATEACKSRFREIRQYGTAFEAEYKHNKLLTFGLYSGFASGRKNFGFQLNDGKVDPLDQPSNFKFDRDYHVDMILFREIIGSVTNATYIKPWVQFDFWTRNRDTFGFRFDAIYSLAHKAGATPSGERDLGLEFDGLLFYREHEKFQADLGYGLLLPGSAFDEKYGRPRLTYPGFDGATFQEEDGAAREAQIAQTIQARMFWFF